MWEKLRQKLRKEGRIPETAQAQPEGEITVVREICFEEKKTGCFSFEKCVLKVELVMVSGQPYVRVMDYDCSSGANGRPCSSLIENYFPMDEKDCECLTADNWQTLAGEVPACHAVQYSNDVLF